MSSNRRPLRLLALDGGGVRGLSELYILSEIMLRIQKRQNLSSTPKPCELFDLICGTSTGGLIALMLGRLRMSVDEVIKEYCNVAKEVFGKPKSYTSEGRFRATVFEKVIQDTVERYGMPKGEDGKAKPGMKLLQEQTSDTCQVFVCSRAARAMNSVRLFRSYRSYTADEYEDMTIWEAARATSAAPTFFKRLKIGPKDAQEEFLDGGLGSNNPAKILLEEAVRKFDNNYSISCIISIGTGKTRITEFKSPGWFKRRIPLDLINALKAMATDCDEAAEALRKWFSSRPDVYFRFNVEHGLEDIQLDEWEELGNLKTKTIHYLQTDTMRQIVNDAANALCVTEPRIAISNLNFTLPKPPSLPPNTTRTRKVTKCIVPFERKVSCFVGRTEVLNNVHTLFNEANADHPKTTIVVLRTMGGQGKTQVALEYCERAQRQDYDFILWANAETKSSLEQSFAHFTKVLAQRKRTQEGVLLEMLAENMSVLDNLREQVSGKKYLMVIDNLDAPSEHGEIKNYLTLGGQGHIIVTSRHLDTERLGSHVMVPPFSVIEGTDLLTQRSGRKESSKDAQDREKIIFALGGLPLGIDQAALLIREKNLTYSQFFTEFQKARTMLLDKDLPEFWEYDKLSSGDAKEPDLRSKIGIQTTWRMSFDYLQNLPLGKSKCHLLTLSAYLSSTSISQSTFSPLIHQLRAVQLLLATEMPGVTPMERLGLVCNSELANETLLLALQWAEPLIEDPDDRTISSIFSDFIRDAYKIGLVVSTQHDEARGTIYSIHPLVARWLVRQDDDSCIIEAIYTASFLIDDIDKDETHISSYAETLQHIVACFSLNQRLPENRRLGVADLHRIGIKMCCFAMDYHILQIEAITDTLMTAFLNWTYALWESEGSTLFNIASLLGIAFKSAQKLKEAKKFLQFALNDQHANSFDLIAYVTSNLIGVHIALEDYDPLTKLFQTFTDLLLVATGSIDAPQSPVSRDDPGRANSDLFEDGKPIENFSVVPRTKHMLVDLPDGFWMGMFHDICLSFSPRYDLGVTSILKLIADIRQLIDDTNNARLQPVLLAAYYNLANLYLNSDQCAKANEQYQHLMQLVGGYKTTDLVIYIELGSSALAAVAMERETAPTNNAIDFIFTSLAREKISARPMEKAQRQKVEISLSMVDFLETSLKEQNDTCWKLSRYLRHVLLPGTNTQSAVFKTKDELGLKLISMDFDAKDLHTAKDHLQFCLDTFGYCEESQAAYQFAHAMAYGLSQWNTCLWLSCEEVSREEASGEEPSIVNIHSIGRAYLNLGNHVEYRRHKERYPNGDWSRVEMEERNRKQRARTLTR